MTRNRKIVTVTVFAVMLGLMTHAGATHPYLEGVWLYYVLCIAITVRMVVWVTHDPDHDIKIFRRVDRMLSQMSHDEKEALRYRLIPWKYRQQYRREQKEQQQPEKYKNEWRHP